MAEPLTPSWKIGAEIIAGGAEEVVGTLAEDPSTIAYLAALVERVRQLEAALKFYADERRYDVDEDGCAIGWESYEGDAILHDGGCFARAALAGGEPSDV